MLSVYVWWYDWGLFLFLLLDLVAILYIFLDSANRRINALAWRLGAVFPALLILPSFFYKFSSLDTRLGMAGLVEPFFWMGLIGAVIPIVLAIVYALTAATRPAQPAAPPGMYPPQMQPPYGPPPPPVYAPPMQAPVMQPPRPIKPKANGWLYVQAGPAAGRSFQLNVGDTRIGRSPDNDIPLEDPEISKGHALIREQGGQFVIQDLGSTNGTFVNGNRLYAVQMLYDGDNVRVGQTTLIFKHA
jgi:hypothetical protein